MSEEKVEGWIDSPWMEPAEESIDLVCTIGPESDCESESGSSESEIEEESESDRRLGSKTLALGTGKCNEGEDVPASKGKNLSLMQHVPLDEDTDNEGEAERVSSPGLKDVWLNEPQFVSDFKTEESTATQKLCEEVELLKNRIGVLEAENKMKDDQISMLKWKSGVRIVRSAHWVDEYKKEVNNLKQKLDQREQDCIALKSANATLIDGQNILAIQNELLMNSNLHLDQQNVKKDQEIQKLQKNHYSIEHFVCNFQWDSQCFDDLLENEAAPQDSKETQTIPCDVSEVETQISPECLDQLQERAVEIKCVTNPVTKCSQATATENISPIGPNEVKREYADVSGSEVTSPNESPKKRVRKEKKSQPRTVIKGYFRWTKERNLLLLNALIKTLKKTYEDYDEFHGPKESEILVKVNESCGNIFPGDKIRDQLNNLLRRYKKENKRELKAYSREYIKKLECIRDQIQKAVEKSATV